MDKIVLCFNEAPIHESGKLVRFVSRSTGAEMLQ